MTPLKTPLIASLEDLHDIPPLDVMYIDGPATGTREHVTRLYPIDGLDAVWSSHGDGFYWLPDVGPNTTGTCTRYAIWEPHSDARFPWARYL